MIYMGFKQLLDPYYQGIAAQIAFFFMLSIVPTLILLSQLLSMFHFSLDTINAYLDTEIAPEILTSFQESLSFDPQPGTNILLMITAIWAASRLQFSLMRITNYTLSGGKDPGSYFKDRIRSIVTVILTILVMMAMVIILAYGQLVMNFLSKKFLISDELDWAWVVFRWPVAGALFLLLISFIYYVLPANKNRRRFKEILPGSIFCAIGMLLVTMVYSSYTAHAVTQNVLYGSMASIAALMFWFYLISWVMCLGILVNKVWLDTSADKVEKERR